jgi:glycosyltransferase involved in cell wall biosynthesis
VSVSSVSSDASAAAPARQPAVMHLACGTGYQSAGVQRHVASLAGGLVARGYRIWVACPTGSWLHRELDSRVRHVPWSEWGLQSRHDFQHLARVMEQERIPLVHAHNRTSLQVALRLRRPAGALIIATAHTMAPYPEYRQADARVAVSRAAAERFRAVTGAAAGAVIHSGVDTMLFQPQPEVRTDVRAELSASPDAPLIVSMSRLAKKSNVRCFVEAAARVRRQHPHAHFALIGDGALPDRLSAWLRQGALGLHSCFHLLGERPDVRRLLCAADTFVLCSQQEALGLALLEAMACGAPVVASRVGGMVEVLVDQESGLYASPEPEDVARKILELLASRERAAAMGQAARARICEQFALTRTVAQHEALYLSLVS